MHGHRVREAQGADEEGLLRNALRGRDLHLEGDLCGEGRAQASLGRRDQTCPRLLALRPGLGVCPGARLEQGEDPALPGPQEGMQGSLGRGRREEHRTPHANPGLGIQHEEREKSVWSSRAGPPSPSYPTRVIFWPGLTPGKGGCRWNIFNTHALESSLSGLRKDTDFLHDRNTVTPESLRRL